MALFGPIPLPKMIPDREPGGPIASTYNKLTNEALAQEMQRLKNQYYGPNIESEISQRQAMTQGQNIKNKFLPQTLQSQIAKDEFRRKYPLLFVPGAAGQVGAQMYLRQNPNAFNQSQPTQSQNAFYNNQGGFPQQNLPQNNQGAFPPQNPSFSQQGQRSISQPSSEDYAQQIANAMQVTGQSKMARADLDKARTQGYTWSQLPADTRNNFIAQGLGMGIDPPKLMKYVNQGLDVRKIAEKEGLDPDNIPPPRYFPTTATKTRTQQVEQVGAELDYLSSATTPIIKRYADTFLGVSGSKLQDMLSDNPDAQKRFGEYIGALSVQTGLANGRIYLEGGKPGVEIMRMVKSSALRGIDEHSPFKMTGLAYETAQKTIDKILQRGAKIRTSIGMNPFYSSQQQEAAKNNNGEKNNIVKWSRDANNKLVRSSS